MVWIGFGEFTVGRKFVMDKFQKLYITKLYIVGGLLEDLPVDGFSLGGCPSMALL